VITGPEEPFGALEEARVMVTPSDRDCCGVVVCGAAGVGKSRIAREATTLAASTGCEVRWVVTTSSARALPLGALRLRGKSDE